jgi:adenine phosphoribosyltransferase
MMKLEKLRGSLASSTIMKRGSYEYFVNPMTDGIPWVDPEVLKEVLTALKEIGDLDCDLIVAPEAMGIPLAVPLSMECGIPYTIVRKKRYGLPGEVAVKQVTGYSESEMYINGICEGDRVTVVDSVISSGGTMRAIIGGLRDIGAEVVDLLVIIEKGTGKKAVEAEFGVRIKSLIRIEVADGTVKIID